MKKFADCRLLVGLMVLMLSCGKQSPSLQLLSHRNLTLPSASAIVYSQNKLWVFGDDAPHLLSLSTDHQELDMLRLWPEDTIRIPKELKPDIESAYILEVEGRTLVIGLGSMSTPTRWRIRVVDLATRKLGMIRPYDSTTVWPGIAERNVEGICVVKGRLVMANRGNLSHPQNHLVLWKGEKVPVVKRLLLPPGKQFAGVSDLCYVTEKDLLLLTASEEATASAYTDGAIGESYLGWIEDFSKQFNKGELATDGWMALSQMNTAFAGQKVEGVCVEQIDGQKLILHLVSDNDGGASRIFKVLLEK